MSSTIEESKSYGLQRALNLDRSIRARLEASDKLGEIMLVSKSSGRQGFLVAPPVGGSIYEPGALDDFTTGLLPYFQPDYRVYSKGSYFDLSGGLSFPELIFDSVPGFKICQGRVVKDPRASSTSFSELYVLSQQAGMEERELVRRIRVRVFPDAELAGFILDYETDVRSREYPLEPGLNKQQFDFIKQDRTRFIQNYRQYLQSLKDRQTQKSFTYVMLGRRNQPILGVRGLL